MPFKDTKEGQTYHDPEAERKAREVINMDDLIKESVRELSELNKITQEIESLINQIAFWKHKNINYTKEMVAKDNLSELFNKSILDWHTKQMEKAYNKGREYGRLEVGGKRFAEDFTDVIDKLSKD